MYDSLDTIRIHKNAKHFRIEEIRRNDAFSGVIPNYCTQINLNVGKGINYPFNIENK